MQLRNVYKRYGRQDVLRGVNLSITPGEFVAIIGKSGSGKSTLMNIMGGIDRPTRGDVIIDGTLINDLRDRELSTVRGRSIGFVFQSFYLQPHLTILDNILLPSFFTKCNRTVLAKRASQIANYLGLSDKLNSRPSQLSGGQVQRVAIARALINNPKIILADEPTGNLDASNSQITVELLKDINRRLKTTVVVVTHDLNVAKVADRIIQISDGAIINEVVRGNK